MNTPNPSQQSSWCAWTNKQNPIYRLIVLGIILSCWWWRLTEAKIWATRESLSPMDFLSLSDCNLQLGIVSKQKDECWLNDWEYKSNSLAQITYLLIILQNLNCLFVCHKWSDPLFAQRRVYCWSLVDQKCLYFDVTKLYSTWNNLSLHITTLQCFSVLQTDLHRCV